ncbi:MAG: SMC-Scp complex subunit ScpB [Planctomycetes bacterium]|nr:SMC-Scp complex subunit ScpB [Planctomycetota bacterium]
MNATSSGAPAAPALSDDPKPATTDAVVDQEAGVREPDAAAPDSTSSSDAAEPLTVDLADPDAEALAAIPLTTRVEALLFAATEPIPLKRLRELTGCPDAKTVREAIESLGRGYTESARAFRVEEIVQGFQLRTIDAVGPVVARLGRRPADDRISTAALETLAVVAYRQPVLRADIEKIRGVACGEVLRALQERGLVRIVGRADLPGSPLLYGTTQRFLEIFGLRDLQELPKDRDLLRPRPE